MNTLFCEAIKLHDGKLYHLSYHQQRLDQTQAAFGGERIILSDILSSIPDYAQHGLFKCRIEYARQVEKVEFVPYVFRHIKTVSIVINDSIDYGFKYHDRRKLEELRSKSGCDDIIIVKRGLVADGFSSNLVFESNDGLFTPDSCLLRGTKRQFLLDTKRIHERRIAIENINSYSRIRFINAMINLEDNIYIDVPQLIM